MRLRLLTALAACACAVPKPLLAKETVVAPPPLPPGCSANLSGEWVHADDPTYAYRAIDDGGTLTLFERRAFPDAGETAPGGQVQLTRSAPSFAGRAIASVLHPSGRICEASFATEVVTCADGGLVLSSASRTSLFDTCAPGRPSNVSVKLRHALQRTVTSPE